MNCWLRYYHFSRLQCLFTLSLISNYALCDCSACMKCRRSRLLLVYGVLLFGADQSYPNIFHFEKKTDILWLSSRQKVSNGSGRKPLGWASPENVFSFSISHQLSNPHDYAFCNSGLFQFTPADHQAFAFVDDFMLLLRRHERISTR